MRTVDDLLAKYRRAAIPALPGSFPSDILREIRLRSTDPSADSGWFSPLFAFLRPGMMAASLSLAFAVGVLVPGFNRANDHSIAVDGLGLNVFSTAKMPSGLLK